MFEEPKSGVNYKFAYSPDMHNSGLVTGQCNAGPNCSDVVLTVKVPLQKAKEIEALRQKGKDMIRVYGKVNRSEEWYTNPRSVSASLIVEGEALEFGSRQDGVFKSYFFLDSDQLKKLMPKKEKAQAVFFGI